MAARLERLAGVLVLVSGLALAGPAMAGGELSEVKSGYEANAANESAKSAPAAGPGSRSKATYALSDKSWFGDEKVGWDGFLTGLKGFEHFYDPIGQPIYFETPFNDTQVRPVFLKHNFDDQSQFGGGDVTVYAVQVRVALTERLGFIATKDGFSDFAAGGLPKDEGWNSIAAGLKYVAYADTEQDLVITPGVRFQLNSGEAKVFQSGVAEISPFVSVAKGWDRLHTLANLTVRVPTDDGDGNTIVQWDLHADYEVAPESLPGFAPVFELHGLHYVTDGDRFPLSVGGLDYTNLGSSDVSGSTVVWAGFGLRWKLSPNVSVGGDYEIGLTNHKADIMKDRIMFDMVFKY